MVSIKTWKVAEQYLQLSLTFTCECVQGIHIAHVHPTHEERVYKDGEKTPVVDCHLSTWDLYFDNKTQQKTETGKMYMSKNNRHQVNKKT